MVRVPRELERLRGALDAAREVLGRGAERGRLILPGVSHWSPLAHVQHLALVDETALRQVTALLDGEDGPHHSGGRRTALGAVLLGLGWIPRGRARAPEGLRPAADPSPGAVAQLLAALGQRLGELEPRAAEIGGSRRRRHHFVFGDLNAAEWLRFASIHSWHHLKIVRDIEAAAPGAPRARVTREG